ncbi:histidine kinase dimerization/phospho-acceptor domain-containing protein [Nocardioides sp. W7]|uniref:histidine kinase dimerization/phospho-acceptor domain-containing protein n=1 Tax=Nocardioides sp. W7 TaxID=2931390 RepID=UPI001FD285F0|nr:histidine kinase dimerization/phospho-acceptor domain-containing protein [Nocardioides sp. W7]
MRERLAASFALFTLVLLIAGGVIRSYTLGHELREQQSDRLHQEATLVARVVDARVGEGEPVDAAFLSELVHDRARIAYTPGVAGDPVEARGPSYDAEGDDVTANVTVDGGTVTVAEDDRLVWNLVVGDPWALAGLGMLALVGSGLAGLLVARRLSAPFQRLADAAGALGRGRFDLDLPRTRIPEAAAIARSLSTSADELRDRLRREQEFAAHTSHALRSPLTGLRLELEETLLRDDLPDEVRTTLRRALDGIAHVDEVAGELVELQRGSLVEGAQVPLRDLAVQVAQHWGDELALVDRDLSAAVQGELDDGYTPGPVEHLLDLVLAAVLDASAGAVRLVLAGDTDGHLRISVTLDRPASEQPTSDQDPFGAARSVCAALGGRWVGSEPTAGIEILLPRR